MMIIIQLEANVNVGFIDRKPYKRWDRTKVRAMNLSLYESNTLVYNTIYCIIMNDVLVISLYLLIFYVCHTF